MTATRTETDSFGPLEVPADKYWGAQTIAAHCPDGVAAITIWFNLPPARVCTCSLG